MTPEEFEEKMEEVCDLDEAGYAEDTEMSHVRADEIMCFLLKELGYSKGIEIFERMNKWYA